MKKITDNIIKFLTTNKLKTFYWTTFNGLIIITATQMADIEWIYAPLLIAILNGITKWVNTEIIPQYKK